MKNGENNLLRAIGLLKQVRDLLDTTRIQLTDGDQGKEFNALTRSIKDYGLLVPISARPSDQKLAEKGLSGDEIARLHKKMTSNIKERRESQVKRVDGAIEVYQELVQEFQKSTKMDIGD